MGDYTALVNPIAGGGQALRMWRPIGDALRERGHAVREELTRSRDHAREVAATAAQRGEAVIAVGGDGLVRDVAAGVYGTEGAMAIVPAGRGNDLARKLALPTDTAGLVQMLAAGATRLIDVIEAAGEIVPGNVYVGLDSVASAAINNNRWLPAGAVYRLAPIGAILRWSAPQFTVTTPDWTTTGRQHLVVVANSGRYGHGLNIVPPAELDSGQLHILMIDNVPRRKVARYLRTAKTGAHVSFDSVQIRPTTQVTICADRQVPVYADGDYLGELPVTATVRPAALRMIAP